MHVSLSVVVVVCLMSCDRVCVNRGVVSACDGVCVVRYAFVVSLV